MMIYSMTKTFTAAAILQLVDKKRLTLDDPVSKFVPNIPYGDRVTVRHLLSQTSGIPNPIPLKWVHLVEEDSSFDEDSVLQKLLKEYPNLDFIPGKKYAYSNLSYWLLGKILENITGMRYKEYMRNNIFRRLNLSSYDIDFIIPSVDNHAKGYLKKISFLNLFKRFVMDQKYFGEYEDGWLHIRNHYLNGPSFGGMIASAGSISAFLQDQLADESILFSMKSRDLFFEQQKNNAGEFIETSLGWHVGSYGSRRYYYKEGGGGGFHCEMRIYSSERIASVVIANNTSFDTHGFLDEVDGESLK
jgi:D-alanyl-D-alanine carboxypeptidase